MSLILNAFNVFVFNSLVFLILSFITRVISVVFGMIIQMCDSSHKCSIINLSTYLPMCPTICFYLFVFNVFNAFMPLTLILLFF